MDYTEKNSNSLIEISQITPIRRETTLKLIWSVRGLPWSNSHVLWNYSGPSMDYIEFTLIFRYTTMKLL